MQARVTLSQAGGVSLPQLSTSFAARYTPILKPVPSDTYRTVGGCAGISKMRCPYSSVLSPQIVHVKKLAYKTQDAAQAELNLPSFQV